MTSKTKPFWRLAAQPFDHHAAEYDAWFDQGPVFAIELAALRALRTPLAAPKLEVGAGPGRFSAALGCRYGLDPAHAALVLAAQRGIQACQGIGEAMPYKTAAFGTVFILFTLCFLAKPESVIAECARVLKPGGNLVIAMVPAAGSWGQLLTRKKDQGHPFYRNATLLDPATIQKMLSEQGFTRVEQRHTLTAPPEAVDAMEQSRDGDNPAAGCIILVARSNRTNPKK